VKKILTICCLIGLVTIAVGQGLSSNHEYTLSGYIKDATNGELLIGATVVITESNTGVATNAYGYYSLSSKPGKYNVAVGFIGYDTQQLVIDFNQNQELNVSLKPKSETIEEIVVTSEKKDANVREVQMGVQKLKPQSIKQVPVLMGETDVIKVIQLLPGVQAASEGSSGFSVRGGNPDQNLILLDEAPIYNAGHFLGFFSVFNNDAFKGLELYKGDIPASHGGRLSSLLDIRMKDGNSQKISGTGGIGLISSRLTLEGPIVSEKTTFVVSGRRTYMDLFIPLFADEESKDSRVYFYDFNAKVNHTINQNNRIYLSGYFGRDVFLNGDNSMDYGNKTVTARWNHLFSQKLFSNFTFVGSDYDYALGGSPGDGNSFTWKSNLQDWGLRADFDYFYSPKYTIEFGGQSAYHEILPGLVSGDDENSIYNEVKVPENQSLEHAVYLSNVHKLNDKLTLKYGLRFSAFQNMGATTVFDYDDEYEVVGETTYGKREIYKTYTNWEPRFGATYLINPLLSVKGSYSRTVQYMQLATNSTSGTPLDVWFPSSPNVKPQKADQFSVGLFRNFMDNTIETSIETFYKKMYNTVDYKDHANLYLNENLEGELRFGDSQAYGAEFLVRFNRPKWNGWIGYTWSQSKRTIPEINGGKSFLAPYDHTHDVSIVLSYQLSKRLSASANWVYITGNPYTIPVDSYVVGGNPFDPINPDGEVLTGYSDRNAVRMPDYHRLDFSLTLKGKKYDTSRWKGEWVFSMYNAYGQKNAWAINFVRDDNTKPMIIEKTYLFTFVPSVSYNFKF